MIGRYMFIPGIVEDSISIGLYTQTERLTIKLTVRYVKDPHRQIPFFSLASRLDSTWFEAGNRSFSRTFAAQILQICLCVNINGLFLYFSSVTKVLILTRGD